MTTFAPNESTLDERVVEAWSAYREDLTDLDGRQYDEAEAESWERLQRALADIESDRAALDHEPGAGA